MADKAAYSTVLSTRAQKEILKAWEWYEDRQQGLGDQFFNEVVSRIQEIEQNPDRYPIRYKFYRETLVATFPFLIIYRINKKEKLIRIVSVFHTSKNPKRKYK